MPENNTLLDLDFDTALKEVEEGAAFIDLRPVDDYFDVHIPGSLELLFEAGPGMAARARDCIPLSIPLILLEEEAAAADYRHAAASLRGKGFTVIGKVTNGINEWAGRRGTPASTEVLTRASKDPGGIVLSVGDPGAEAFEDVKHIPLERLWSRADEVKGESPVVVVSGFGVRAALAVGILERSGIDPVMVLKTRT